MTIISEQRRLLVILIILLGSVLRIYRLGSIPAGFFCDEASIGYNAYQILTTGKDQFGVKFPMFFRAFGEYKSPIQIYSTVPFIWLFGLNEFSVRAVSVIYGILGIWGIYLMARELFEDQQKKELIGLLSALFLAISPWHIHFSRVAFELMPFIFFTEMGIYFWLRSRKNIHSIYLAVVFLILALYSYFSARIFIPAQLGFLLLIDFRRLKKTTPPKSFWYGLMIFCIAMIPFVQGILNGNSIARWNQLSLKGGLKFKTAHFVKAYLNYYSLDFLFSKGDIGFSGQNVTRHSIKGMGELYGFQSGLVVAGLLWLIVNIRKKESIIIVSWLVLQAVAPAMTIDINPLATRGIAGVVVWQIISAIGAIAILKVIETVPKKPGKKIGLILIIVAVWGIWALWSSVQYYDGYFNKYNLYSSDYWGWQSGPKEIISYFMKVRYEYDELYMTGYFNAPDIFLKFYDPENKCRNCFIGGIDRLNLSKKQLFALTAEEALNNSNFQLKAEKIIRYPNNRIAFYIGEFFK